MPTHRLTEVLKEVWQCPRCAGDGFTLDEASAPGSRGGFTGRLRCGSCSSSYWIQDDVLHLLDETSPSDTLRIKKAYDAIWDRGEASWSEEELSGETAIFDWARSRFQGGSILDAGCGTGRNLGEWMKFRPRLLVMVDIADAIYLAKRKFEALPEPRPAALFIKGSIDKLPLKPGAVDLSWSSGVISVIDDQNKPLREIFRVTRRDSYLGLPTEKTLTGQVYLGFNPVRRLLSLVPSDRTVFGLAGLAAFGAVVTIRLLLLIAGKRMAPATRSAFTNLLARGNVRERLQVTLFDILRAPRITKHPDRFYVEAASACGFASREQKLNAASEHFHFRREQQAAGKAAAPQTTAVEIMS